MSDSHVNEVTVNLGWIFVNVKYEQEDVVVPQSEIMSRIGQMIEGIHVGKKAILVVGYSEDQKIWCIKEVRNITGMSLKDAKDWVEEKLFGCALTRSVLKRDLSPKYGKELIESLKYLDCVLVPTEYDDSH